MSNPDLRYTQRAPMLYFKQGMNLKVIDSYVLFDDFDTTTSLDNFDDSNNVANPESVFEGEKFEEAYDTHLTSAGHIGTTEVLASDFAGNTDIHIWTPDEEDSYPDFETEEVITNRQGNCYYASEVGLPVFLVALLRKDTLTDDDYVYLYEGFSRYGVLAGTTFDPITKIQVKTLWALLKDPTILVLLTILTFKELKQSKFKAELEFLCNQIKSAKPFISFPAIQVFISQLKEPRCIKDIVYALIQEKDIRYARKVAGALFATNAFKMVILKLRSNEYKETVQKLVKTKLKKTLNLLSLLSDGINFEAFFYLLSDFDFRTYKNELYEFYLKNGLA